MLSSRTSTRDSGSAMIEFALVLPLLLLLVMGIVDFGRALNYWIYETHLANEAARFAAVGRNPGNDSGGLTLQEWTRAQAVTTELRDDLGMQVCLDFPKGPQVGEPVEVKVSATFNWLPFLADPPAFLGGTGLTDVDLSGSSTMRLEAREDLFETGIAEGCV
jgi:Flp pilus assembly protein TadG